VLLRFGGHPRIPGIAEFPLAVRLAGASDLEGATPASRAAKVWRLAAIVFTPQNP
jgi:hypothetical protein